MIDPTDSLAFSIQANRGVYALLIGSGASQAAQIPTGWDITLDLIRKLAAASGESAERDPELWYRTKYDEAPDYSKLIDGLAKTQTERQQLLRPYFEPNEEEREENAKQPTAAHKAIAWLVAQGFVKVIITTNFDRLLEKALEEAGVEPVVISTEDQVKGMVPLVHTQHCLVKLHGDYLDTRIRNTPSELSEYSDVFNQLLERIFDEFGLIVCGWSADWDVALRNAMFRAPSRRFTTYWAARGEPSEQAQRLIDNRRAQVISIDDADSFFQKVQHSVASIEEFSKPHPLSTAAAVASLKRFLSESRFRIRLADLIDENVQRVIKDTSGPDFDVYHPPPTTDTVTERIRKYEVACSTLMAMAIVGGRWAKAEDCEIWHRALQRLSMIPRSNGNVAWLDLRLYPGMLLLYALGLGAVETDRLAFLGPLFSAAVHRENNERVTVVQAFAPYQRFDGGGAMKMLEGMANSFPPLNAWMLKTLRPHTKRIISDDERYTTNFVKLEILMSLNSVYRPNPALPRTTRGVFLYDHYETSWDILQGITDSISIYHDESPFVRADIFGQTSEDCMQHIDRLKQWISDAAQQLGTRRWQALQEQADRNRRYVAR